MRKLAIFFLTAASVSAWAQSAQLKGYEAVERILGERLLVSGDFDFTRYFSGMEARDIGALLLLLGGTPVNSGLSQFENGEPNAVNMLMWDLVANGVSQDLGSSCVSSPQGLALNPTFAKALSDLCAWPATDAQTATVMENFWLALMSYDAPEDEYSAWRDFFTQSSFSHRPASEAVPAMVTAILLNPYFQLHR